MFRFPLLPALLAFPLVASAATPNVVVVMTDDQGMGDFSFTGNPVLKTPNFDAFARQAVRFTDFHVAPMCSPTRGPCELLSGQLLFEVVSWRADKVICGTSFSHEPAFPSRRG